MNTQPLWGYFLNTAVFYGRCNRSIGEVCCLFPPLVQNGRKNHIHSNNRDPLLVRNLGKNRPCLKQLLPFFPIQTIPSDLWRYWTCGITLAVSMNLFKTKVVVSVPLELLPKVEMCIGTPARKIHVKLSRTIFLWEGLAMFWNLNIFTWMVFHPILNRKCIFKWSILHC